MNYIKKWLRIFFSAFLLLLLASCSKIVDLTHFVPIQMARIPHTETYNQTFDITSFLENSTVLDKTENERIDEHMDEIFIRLLGRKNWQYLKDLYGSGSIREELKNGGVYVHGIINSTIYLVPNGKTPNKFVMEGFGRWFVIRKVNRQILLSGDSIIRPKEIEISELEKGKIRLDIDFFVTRIPRRPSFYQKSHVAIDIIIDTSQKAKKVFSTNYDVFHKVYLIDNKKVATKLADLKFENPVSKYKLLDMRGIRLIQNDYSN